MLLNKTLLSLFAFILPLPAFSRVSALAACLRTHAKMTSAAAAAAMHKDAGLAHRPTDVALALHDDDAIVLLNQTLPSLFAFILPLPAISRVFALAACQRATL
jgi:hypothetical protein